MAIGAKLMAPHGGLFVLLIPGAITPVIGYLMAIIIGSLIGLAQGALTAYLNIPAFIVTLGGLLAWRGAVKAITKSETIPIADSTFKAIGQQYIDPMSGWILAGAAILFVLAVAFRRAQTQKNFEL